MDYMDNLLLESDMKSKLNLDFSKKEQVDDWK